MQDIIRIKVTKNSLVFYFCSTDPKISNDGGLLDKKEYTHTFGNKDFEMFTYEREIETFASMHQICAVTKYWESDKTFIFSFIENHDPILNFKPVCMTCQCGNSIHSK